MVGIMHKKSPQTSRISTQIHNPSGLGSGESLSHLFTTYIRFDHRLILVAFNRSICEERVLAHMYSDNGTTLVGADKSLKTFFKEN